MIAEKRKLFFSFLFFSSSLCLLLQLIDGRQRLCHVRCLRLASVPRTLQNTLVSSSDPWKKSNGRKERKLTLCLSASIQ